jgi:hypothetical protein
VAALRLTSALVREWVTPILFNIFHVHAHRDNSTRGPRRFHLDLFNPQTPQLDLSPSPSLKGFRYLLSHPESSVRPHIRHIIIYAVGSLDPDKDDNRLADLLEPPRSSCVWEVVSISVSVTFGYDLEQLNQVLRARSIFWRAGSDFSQNMSVFCFAMQCGRASIACGPGLTALQCRGIAEMLRMSVLVPLDYRPFAFRTSHNLFFTPESQGNLYLRVGPDSQAEVEVIHPIVTMFARAFQSNPLPVRKRVVLQRMYFGHEIESDRRSQRFFDAILLKLRGELDRDFLPFVLAVPSSKLAPISQKQYACRIRDGNEAWPLGER